MKKDPSYRGPHMFNFTKAFDNIKLTKKPKLSSDSFPNRKDKILEKTKIKIDNKSKINN